MQDVVANIPLMGDGQVLINIGPVIRNGEIVQYEQPFIEWMRSEGYKFFDPLCVE